MKDNKKRIQADSFSKYYSSEKEPDKDYHLNPLERFFWDRLGSINKDALKDREGMVLDVGCGVGRLLTLCRELSRDAMVVGTDLEFRMKEKDISSVLSDAEYLPFKDESFDFIICTELLEHLPNLQAGFSEVSRLLKKEGFAYITTPNKKEPIDHGVGSAIRKILQTLRIYDPLCRLGVKRGWFTESSYLLSKLDQEHKLHVSEMDRGEFLRHLRNNNLEVFKSYDAPLNFALFSPFARFNVTLWLYKKLNSFDFLKPYKHIVVIVQKGAES